jgi:uncharacterized membrane protein (DUF441 family)
MGVRVIIINCWRFMVVVTRGMSLKHDQGKIVRALLHGTIIRPDNIPTEIPTVPLPADGLLEHFRTKAHLYEIATRDGRP